MLYLRALRAKNKDAIVKVATDEHAFLMKHTHHDTNFFNSAIDLFATHLECTSMINEIFVPYPSLTSNAYFVISNAIYSGVVMFWADEPAVTARALIGGFFGSVDWSRLLDYVLPHFFHSTPLRRSISVVATTSLYQYSIHLIYKRVNKSKAPFSLADNLGTLLSIFSLNLANFGINLVYTKSNIPFLQFLANITFSLYSSLFLREIINRGFSQVFNSLVPLLHSTFKKDVDYQVELSDDIPNELICPICFNLLNDPICCQGHAFCKSCFSTWSAKSPLHPFTGLGYRREEIEPAYVYDVLSNNYKMLLSKTRLAQQESK